MSHYNAISNINALGEHVPTVDPECRRDYTFREIVTTLDLDDSPALTFEYNGEEQNIQDSHVTNAELLLVPHWADALWTYQTTTEEWVPIFTFAKANTIQITDLVDIAPAIDPFAETNRELWITPKNHPREQHYRIEGDKIVSDNDTYDLVEFDDKGYSRYYYDRVNNPGCCAFCKNDVDKRRGYRDPEEGSGGPVYEACVPCIERRIAADREAYREEQEQYEYEHGADDYEPDYPEDEDNMDYEDDEPDYLDEDDAVESDIDADDKAP